MPENLYTIDRFMDLLICSFVLHEKLELCITDNSPQARLDRQGLTAMHEHTENAVETYVRKMGDKDGNDWFHFLVRIRNELQPGNHGSFPGLRSELVAKTTTLVGLLSPHGGSYHFPNDKALAKSILAQGEPRLQLYTGQLVDTFLLRSRMGSSCRDLKRP